MRTQQATGSRWTAGRARWVGTAVAAFAAAAAAGGGVGHAAESTGMSVPARADFDYLGSFANVPSAPPGTPAIGGIASMVVTTRATTTAIDATGLDPKSVYVADVHDQPCFMDEGGKRFRFDPNGSQEPPNAIWLTPIEVDSDGRGAATTTSPRPAGPRARSVVIHLQRPAGADKDNAHPPKLACADLPRVTS